ncbi:MAG: hypothetical protein DRO90_00070 [Candidatus Altiarchaeales archaeon]|nr:MAG: hypothetical protein DRO95_00510 [Candidatus Altiarchaeales archaeon]RLI95556.1 MAG: hypothetical protein DRO94_00305 [Candidatus Altiarchaeales archaeon]RLI95595.1 MAG: hypothetical protein DRO90_00070 [Candidatus Altiarchaeales archaeon]HDO82539.1 hypothetical protein [Candidatus Altiarchaeales archaeon]HEX55188.1 hypothetical protein [Candidatus Altiarchaeales archaeon]
MKLFHKGPHITSKSIERLKLENYVIDESGKRPVAISVVIPTFNKNDKKYNKAVLNIISKCGDLIDSGIIDEVVIAEGSRTRDGRPDIEFMEFLLAAAIRSSRTFEREVEFIRSMPEGKQKALQGRYDFSFRILSQVDPELHNIYLNQGILNEEEIGKLKHGKGANLWFSVPATYGDIICFIDSDILSFKRHYIRYLCEPILRNWISGEKHKEKSRILFTKASYIRQHKIPGGYTLGGRLSRLVGIPILNVLARHGIFNGLDSISYPFSGECALTRGTLNELQFSNGYDIEISILCQLWKRYGVERIAQPDLGFFQHLPGNEEHAEEMLLDISIALFYWIRRYKLINKIRDIDKLLDEYEETAKNMLPLFERIARERPSRISYTPEDMNIDLERISKYRSILKRGYELSRKREPKLLRPWAEIRDKINSRIGYNYQNLKTTLQMRVNKFTSNMILSYIRIYVDRSADIIRRFTE